MHLTCAAALFILLGAISLFIFPLDMSPAEKLKGKWRTGCYRGLGVLIWLSIVLMPSLNWLVRSFYNDYHVFFILETICVMAFAVSFILKGHGQANDRHFSEMAERQPPAAGGRPPDGGDVAPAQTPQPTGLP